MVKPADEKVVPKSGTLWPSAGWEAKRGVQGHLLWLLSKGMDWTGETGYLGLGWASCTVWETLGHSGCATVSSSGSLG